MNAIDEQQLIGEIDVDLVDSMNHFHRKTQVQSVLNRYYLRCHVCVRCKALIEERRKTNRNLKSLR